MSDGERDGFIENDVIGNFAVGTNAIGRVANRKFRRKSVKSRKKVKHSTRRRKKSVRRNRVHKKSRGGIKYTKNGQPYKIMSNGRARFIKGRRKK